MNIIWRPTIRVRDEHILISFKTLYNDHLFLVSYNEVISAYTSQAKSKHFKGVTEELNTTTNVLYLALNAFVKLDQHVVEEYIQFSGLKDVRLDNIFNGSDHYWHVSY